jgi:hypothetical protein
MNLPEQNKLVLVEVFSAGQTIYDLVKLEDNIWFCHEDGEGYYFIDEIVKWCYVEDIKVGWNELT